MPDAPTAQLLDHLGAFGSERVQKHAHLVAHLGGLIESTAAIARGPLRQEEDLGETEVFFGARMVVDLAVDDLAVLGAHLLQKGFVDVVVEIDEGTLFGGHGTHPVLVVLELGQWQIERLRQVVALFLADRAE